QVNLAAMVLVVRETFVHLGFRQRRQAAAGDTVHCFAILQEADHIVDTDTSALHARVTISHVRRSNDVAIGPRNLAAHGLILRPMEGVILGVIAPAKPEDSKPAHTTETGRWR